VLIVSGAEAGTTPPVTDTVSGDPAATEDNASEYAL